MVAVELRRDIPSQFQMLFLVLADRHVGGLVNQDIRRYEIGVGV